MDKGAINYNSKTRKKHKMKTKWAKREARLQKVKEEELEMAELDQRILNVLKDPVQCPNEHYYCPSCVEKHVHENTATCPMCQHHLKEIALTKPPRILRQMLHDLKIRGDYAKRGCRELIKLEFLDRHVENCGYSPTAFTKPGCNLNEHYFRQFGCNLDFHDQLTYQCP